MKARRYLLSAAVLLVGLVGLAPAPLRAEYPELAALREFGQLKLLVYSQKLASVDGKYEGVAAFGKALSTVVAPASDIPALTLRSRTYWRALVEIAPGDPSVFFSVAWLDLAQGKVARAGHQLALGNVGRGVALQADVEAYEALRQKLEDRVASEIAKGVALHDAKAYPEAVAAYDAVLAEYPECARAWFEKSFSYHMMGPAFFAQRDAALAKCRAADPLYARGYGGKDLAARRQALAGAEPFLSGKAKGIDGLRAFALAAEKAGVYEYAALARWKLVGFDAPEAQKGQLRAFLDDVAATGLDPKDAGFLRGMFKVD